MYYQGLASGIVQTTPLQHHKQQLKKFLIVFNIISLKYKEVYALSNRFEVKRVDIGEDMNFRKMCEIPLVSNF
jgi:hypothetical protein